MVFPEVHDTILRLSTDSPAEKVLPGHVWASHTSAFLRTLKRCSCVSATRNLKATGHR